MNMKLLKIRKIKGTITVLTGLHIGAGNDTVEIGGVDSPIIKNKITNEPYIPGSSLKGKMRSLYEMKEGKLSANGDPCSCGKKECDVCRIFGSANNKDENKDRGPTRIIVRDAFMNEECKKQLENEMLYTEIKTENNINRITARATPRSIERVLPSVKFDFEIILRIFNEAEEEKDIEIIKKCLSLVKNDALGGGGSRGSGKVEIDNIKEEKINYEQL